MKSSSRVVLSILSICLILGGTKTVEASTEKNNHLFVLDDVTGLITEYNVKDFSVRQTLQIPKDLYFLKTKSHLISKGLSISGSGRILYYDDEIRFDYGINVRRLWYWDGEKEHRLEISKNLNCLPASDRCFVSDDVSPPILDVDEAKFYWTIDHITRLRQEPTDAEYSMKYITLDVELYRVYFGGDKLVEELVAKIPFKECECSTGACNETCPTGYIVAPAGGVKNFIEVEHFVQGQLESSVEGYTYFEKIGNKWIKTTVNKKLERPFVQVVYDGGCCSWINESSDLLLVIDGKKENIIYDEWKRFNNLNYDISFHPVNAELSPNLKKIAYTIVPNDWALANFKRDGMLRLSSGGKENIDELNKIKTVLNDLPMTEVVPIDKKGDNIVVIKKAELVGWLDNNKLLVLRDDKLGTFDISTQQFIESSIRIKSTKQIFLR